MNRGTIGVDIGGTKIAVGVVDTQGNMLSKRVFSTTTLKGPEAITKQIAQEIQTLLREGTYAISAIGVGLAGQIDSNTGLIHFAPNLGWKEFPFGHQLSQEMGIPVAVTNDVKAATLGEWVFGAGKGHSNVVCMFVGTGIGGGLICNGDMLDGTSNSAGEIGHIVIDLDGPSCHCGNEGCLEAVAGGWAIGRTAREGIKKNPEQGAFLLGLSGGDIEMVTAKVVSQACLQDDPLSLQIFERVEKGLAAGVISLVNAFNPSCFILGGGVIEGHRSLIEKIEARVRKKALPVAVKSLAIQGTLLGSNAGVVGAAYYGQQKLKRG